MLNSYEFVLKSHRNAVFSTSPNLFSEPIIQLRGPLAPQEGDDRVATGQEFAPIAPARIDRVGQCDPLGIA